MNSPTMRWMLVALILLAGVVLTSGLMRLRPTAPRFREPQALENALAPQLGSRQDVPGRDLKTVPRYLPSVRIFFSEEGPQGVVGESYMIMYQCEGELQQVSTYYEREMTNYGWRLAIKDETTLHMQFIRQEARRIGPPLVQVYFRPLSAQETAVSILAIDAQSKHP